MQHLPSPAALAAGPNGRPGVAKFAWVTGAIAFLLFGADMITLQVLKAQSDNHPAQEPGFIAAFALFAVMAIAGITYLNTVPKMTREDAATTAVQGAIGLLTYAENITQGPRATSPAPRDLPAGETGRDVDSPFLPMVATTHALPGRE